ncbi:MAG TPA: transporter substrate-binding domain-containing protein [Actinospica sp.]|jgi:polar amino acid transport system substrate-binding protein|nr:transporter substrate-binding domain-containing protein [Actinospica sp.]
MPLSPARRRFVLPAVALAVSASALLAGCGSSSGTSANAADASPGASAGYPTSDVVSAVAEDTTLHAALLAADPGAANGLALGTTYSPGLTGLPHVGENSAGQNVGADVDLRNAVAKVLGTTWTVQNGTFATIIPGVQNGRFAVGQDNFGVTAAREKIVDFATYLTDGQALLAPSDSTLQKVTDITQLCGLTVGTGAGTTFQTILTGNAPKCAAAGKKPYTVQYFSDNAAIWLGLANGRIDVYFGPTLGLEYDAAHVANVKFLSQVSSTPVGFVTAKGSPLAKLLSEAVNELIRDGEYQRILDKWSITGNGIKSSALNPKPTL